MTSRHSDTDWVKPGASIAVYVDGREGRNRLRHTTVKSVAAKSFLVEGIIHRFQFDTMETKDLGGAWNRWNYVAAHPDSDIVRDVGERDKRDRQRASARPYLTNGVDSLEKVDEAIRELTAWRAVLAAEVSQ